MNNVVIFASGSGTNAANIIDYFKDRKGVDVKLVVCNNPKAGVIERAEKRGVPVMLIDRNTFYNRPGVLLSKLKEIDTTLIVLAGFLWLVPDYLTQTYENRIINIHPALLPKYGGKGMYGMNVHRAVIDAGETESGITIHFVNEKYDEGLIIAQFKCRVLPGDTPEKLAERIHKLEYKHFPVVIEEILLP